MVLGLRIGHVKDTDGSLIYFAFIPKDTNSDKKLQEIILAGSPLPANLNTLTKFHVEDKDYRKASRAIREYLVGIPFDPAQFWESHCPWLMN